MVKKAVTKIFKNILVVGFYYALQILIYCIFTCMLSLIVIKEGDFLQALIDANEIMNHNNNLVYILTSCSSLCILLLFLKKARNLLWQNLKSNKMVFKKALWILGLGMAVSFITNICISFIVKTDNTHVIARGGQINMVLYCIGAIVVAAVTEEIIYREVMFRDLATVTSLPVAIVISSLIFAVSHGNLIQFVYTFLMGGLFAILLYAEDSVLYSIVAHVGFNLTAIALLLINQLSIYWVIGGVILSIAFLILTARQVVLWKSHKRGGETNDLLS